MIVSSAPGRCGVVGNPTDGYGGSVISSSLSESATVRIAPAEAVTLHICGHEESIGCPDALALNGGFCDVAKAVMTRYPEVFDGPRFRLEADTTVPIESGLAGSTTMLVAILGAVLRLLDRTLPPHEIAEVAREIDFDLMRCVCGFQDQYMAVFGGLNHMDFRGKDPNSTGERVYATVENVAIHQPNIPLLLASTGVRRHSGSVHKGFRERWIEGDPEVVGGYERAAAMARSGKVAIMAGDWERLGRLMNDNHAIQRDLGGSGDANERLIAAALEAGALGAKLAGAGKGGTIIALHQDPELLADRLRDAGAARIIPVKPSAGLTVDGEL